MTSVLLTRVRTVVFVAFAAGAPVRAQDPPHVVSLSPANFSCDADCKTTTQLVVTFDADMNRDGFSLCGGGPAFPKLEGGPTWKDARTLVATVTLEPDHSYSLSLNCPAATNFRSKTGAILAPVSWTFETLPAELPKRTVQRKRNQKAFAELGYVIAERYSHQDLRVHDWRKLWAGAREGLLGAPTDKVFASRAAFALTPTEDIHLSLRHGDRVFPTGRRAIDSLFRHQLLATHFKTLSIGKQALAGRTEAGIGYLLIDGWGQELDLAGVESALAAMRDANALVIDVRPNSGGDERLAQKIAAWFVEGTRTYAKNRYRERAGKNGFGPVLDRQVTGNSDPARRIRCPIAVLSSRYVMSSNESFVMMMRQAPDCTVVGQATYGSSGNPKPFELSNGVTLVVPTWQDLRLDGSCFEGEGLAPDVAVDVDSKDLETHDPILERALEILRAKPGK